MPFITRLANISMASGLVPHTMKEIYITSIIKPQPDKMDITNYRHISNLSVILKLLKSIKMTDRLFRSQLVNYLDRNKLMPPNQSAYRKVHSTETALTAVFSNIIEKLDKGYLAFLTMLDLMAALIVSTTISCSTIWKGRMAFIDGSSPYLTNRTQCCPSQRPCVKFRKKSAMVSHRDLFTDPYFFCCTMQTLTTSSTTTALDHTTMPTTFNFRCHALLRQHSSSGSETRQGIVSTISTCRCGCTVYVSTHRRWNLCSMQHQDAASH